jgi:TRAP-type C4-dicarboxylate transport system permease small subunit
MSTKEKIDTILGKVLVIIMSLLVIDVLWQVISRYVLSAPSSFTDELAGFLLIWVGMLGAAYIAGQRGHLAIDLMLQKASPKKKRRLEFFIDFSIALFSLFIMVIGGGWLVITRFMFNVSSAALHIPLGYVYMIMPISGLIILYYSIYFIKNLKGDVA